MHMTTFRKALVVRLGLLLALVLAGCAPIVPIDLTGGWIAEILWIDGPAAGFRQGFVLDLVHEGNDLSGEVTLPSHAMQTFDLPITFGRTRSQTLEIEASGANDLLTPPVPVFFTLEGDFDATSVAGTGTQTVQGSTYHFTWTATLAYPPVPEP
jgi:hypothetical protein